MTARKINKLDKEKRGIEQIGLPRCGFSRLWNSYNLGNSEFPGLNALTVQISRLYRYHKGKIRSS